MGSTSMSRLAVWSGYLLPLIILMVLVIGLSKWWGSDSELSVALCSLACVALYYLLLFFFGKNKMKKTFRFTISKMN
jgi:positive regulator of sigma E activity